MALNNLERLAAQGDRAALLRTLGGHPGAIHLLARLGGTSQFLADTLRRYPQLLAWLLEPRIMRQWLADEFEAELNASLAPFTRREARWNALRRFKYRQLLRIGSRDILGDADLTVTTEELSRLADVCLAAACRWAEEALEPLYGVPTRARRHAHGVRRDRHGQARGRRAQLFLRHRPHLRLRRRRRDQRRKRGLGAQRPLLRGGGQGGGGGGGVDDRRGLCLPRGPAAPPRGPLGRPHPVAGGLSRLLRRPRRAVGASGAHQGAPRRGRCARWRLASSSWSGPSCSGPASTRPSWPTSAT